MEVSVPTLEELATAVVSSPTPTVEHTYATTVSLPMLTPILLSVSSSVPTPMPIYSTLTTPSPIPSTLVPICDAIRDTLRYAFVQEFHPAMLPQQSALVQSKTSVQSHISSPMVSHPPPFNVHLDPADMDVLRKKVEDCKSRQGKVLLEEGKVNR